MQTHADALGGLVDEVVRVDGGVARLMAERAVAIDRLRACSEAGVLGASAEAVGLARRVLVSELACALRVPERTAENLVEASRSLVHELPATWEALHAGAISYRHAGILVEQAVTLTPENRAALEAATLPAASRLTASQFERRARKARERLDAESITARHQRSVLDRAVFYEPASDGMAWLSQYLPAEEAAAIYTRLTTHAMSLQGPNETRTLTQLRADVFADLLLNADPEAADDAGPPVSARSGTATPAAAGQGSAGPSAGPGAGLLRGIRPDVCLLVPVLSLLGHSDEPATLEGYGPIDMDTARELVGKATSFIRILTQPETGTFLSVGRSRYRVPTDLRTVLRLRDGTCRFPGCNRAATHCDIDHTTDWELGGATSCVNLAHLCAKHHKLKHDTDWRVAQARDGSGRLDWTSPSGHRYSTEPEIRIGPTPITPARGEHPPPARSQLGDPPPADPPPDQPRASDGRTEDGRPDDPPF